MYWPLKKAGIYWKIEVLKVCICVCAKTSGNYPIYPSTFFSRKKTWYVLKRCWLIVAVPAVVSNKNWLIYIWHEQLYSAKQEHINWKPPTCLNVRQLNCGKGQQQLLYYTKSVVCGKCVGEIKSLLYRKNKKKPPLLLSAGGEPWGKFTLTGSNCCTIKKLQLIQC